MRSGSRLGRFQPDPSLTAPIDPFCVRARQAQAVPRGRSACAARLSQSLPLHLENLKRLVAVCLPLFGEETELLNAAAIMSWENGTQEWPQCLGRVLWAGGTLGGLARKRFPLGRDGLLVAEPAPCWGLCWVPLSGLYSLPEHCPARN